MNDVEIMEALLKMDIDELKTLNKRVINRIKSLRESKGADIVSRINVGDIVSIDDKNHVDDKFEIVKINRKRAVVRQVGTSQKYSVPFGMIIDN